MYHVIWLFNRLFMENRIRKTVGNVSHIKDKQAFLSLAGIDPKDDYVVLMVAIDIFNKHHMDMIYYMGEMKMMLPKHRWVRDSWDAVSTNIAGVVGNQGNFVDAVISCAINCVNNNIV